MRYRALQHATSILLLAIYLPTVIMSSLHVHHDTVDTHDDCLKCVGHFEKQHHHQQDCQYCNFLSLEYFSQASVQSTVPLHATDYCSADIATRTEMSRYGVSLLRAPPERMR